MRKQDQPHRDQLAMARAAGLDNLLFTAVAFFVLAAAIMAGIWVGVHFAK